MQYNEWDINLSDDQITWTPDDVNLWSTLFHRNVEVGQSLAEASMLATAELAAQGKY